MAAAPAEAHTSFQQQHHHQKAQAAIAAVLAAAVAAAREAAASPAAEPGAVAVADCTGEEELPGTALPQCEPTQVVADPRSLDRMPATFLPTAVASLPAYSVLETYIATEVMDWQMQDIVQQALDAPTAAAQPAAAADVQVGPSGSHPAVREAALLSAAPATGVAETSAPGQAALPAVVDDADRMQNVELAAGAPSFEHDCKQPDRRNDDAWSGGAALDANGECQSNPARSPVSPAQEHVSSADLPSDGCGTYGKADGDGGRLQSGEASAALTSEQCEVQVKPASPADSPSTHSQQAVAAEAQAVASCVGRMVDAVSRVQSPATCSEQGRQGRLTTSCQQAAGDLVPGSCAHMSYSQLMEHSASLISATVSEMPSLVGSQVSRLSMLHMVCVRTSDSRCCPRSRYQL